MDTDHIPLLQLPLFDYGETVTSIVELFPAVWQATEFLTYPDTSSRQRGIDLILELGAQRVSPLVAYIVATCLNDTDIYIRRRVVFILAELVGGDPGIKQTPEVVRKVILYYLHNMNEATVYGLLEVAVTDEQAEKSIYHLFNTCPYVGKYLGEILNQWKHPLSIRQKAIYFIGLVGYLEALPALERLYNRLESRQNGQYSMPFVPTTTNTDMDLLPHLRVAMTRLGAC
jgi:hypothetical protein